MSPKKELNVSANPLPISFKEFAKNPTVGSLFLTFCAIAYMFVSQEKKDTLQKEKDERQDVKTAQLYDMVRKSDSANAASTAQLKMALQLNAIKKFD